MTNVQDQIVTREWLINQGWSYAAAARRLGVTTVHVYLVVAGKRKSNTLVRKLLDLPKRPFKLRERVTH